VTDPNEHVFDADTLTDELRPIRRAALALGSNLGDRLDYLQAAVDAITESPGISPVAVSSVYETEPVGTRIDQPNFLNAVLILDTSLPPRSLFERCKAAEDAFGRSRKEPKGPRTLDLDLLAVGDYRIDDPDLVVPHPQFAERAFVLIPWAEVDPDFEVPGYGRVGELLAASTDKHEVRRLDDVAIELPD
jgi:2-amino-4-hydroxy-6-hydroxymethyldihydropteridine diphosphokinase